VTTVALMHATNIHLNRGGPDECAAISARRMVFRAWAFTLIGLISVVVMAADASSAAISNADPATPAPTPGDRSGAVTFDDLLRARVPALCQHDPGNLVHGQLPPQDGHPGNVGIALNYATGAYKVAFGDLTGSGTRDAAMVTDCSAGGVPWAETVQLYTAGPQLDIAGPARLGGIDLSDLTHSRELVTDLSISDGVAHVTWMANGPNDRECCPTVKMTGDLRWDGSTVAAQNVHRVN
jgi:hypothetical protein